MNNDFRSIEKQSKSLLRTLSPLPEQRERSATLTQTIEDIKVLSPRLRPKIAQNQPSPFYLFRCNRSKMSHMGIGLINNDLSFDYEDEISSLYTDDNSVNEESQANIQSQRKEMLITRNRALSMNSNRDDETILVSTYRQNKLFKKFYPQSYKAKYNCYFNYNKYSNKDKPCQTGCIYQTLELLFNK